jgi:hypothetical protein
VFDEVDMKTSSLCSGYTFILSTPERVYLWKGRGAIRDEVSVARVVTGQISGGDFAEYNEEEEPDAFFDVLGGYEDYSSADYWHLRPTCRKYAPRLFKIDMESRYKVGFDCRWKTLFSIITNRNVGRRDCTFLSG